MVKKNKRIVYDPDVDIIYNASKTGAKFHASKAKVKCLRGPVGSGKSSTCVNHALMLGKLQQPHPDGIRRTKGLIIRNTYSDLITTVLPTWQTWFPPHIFGEPRGKSPIRHRIRIDDVDMLVIFMAFDRERDLKKFRSLELTWVWINEGSEMPFDIFQKATERVNRYPLKRSMGVFPTRPEVFIDTNSPDETNWIYRVFEENKYEGYEILAQPPAMIKEGDRYRLNPNAENLENLAPTYYQDLIQGKGEDYINTMVLNRYGYLKIGNPVYGKTYNDELHCPDREPVLDVTLPIGLGWDFARNPACSIMQRQSDGSIIDIGEIFAFDISFENFLDTIAMPYLLSNFGGYTFISVGDPSGNGRYGTNDETALTALAARGFPTERAKSNDPLVRIAAADYFLTRMINGRPAYQLSRKCPFSRQGFIKGYCYEKLKVLGEDAYKAVPTKNKWSHIHDAKQYILLYYRACDNELGIYAKKKEVYKPARYSIA